MFTQEAKREFSSLLEKSIEQLDISDAQFEEAEKRYKTVGEWLGGESSPLARYEPDIKPQGSFRLGTVVRPWGREDEFDLDLTYKMVIPKTAITQETLKKMVGDRLKENALYKRMLDEEKRRCWRLLYSDGTKFHMDIIPCIQDDPQWLISLGVPPEIAAHAICITDRKSWNFSTDWPRNNPEGYALWFTGRMKARYLLAEASLRMSLQIDKVPYYRIKTPLQRSIQLLKRHRDSMYIGDDDKPASIIITTLAAHAYENEENLYDTLINILRKMDNPMFLKIVAGEYRLVNPVNPAENFAEKWKESPRKQARFFTWLKEARRYFEAFTEMKGFPAFATSLNPVLGERFVGKALSSIAESHRIQRESGQLRMAAGTGTLGSVGTKVRDHNFHGR